MTQEQLDLLEDPDYIADWIVFQERHWEDRIKRRANVLMTVGAIMFVAGMLLDWAALDMWASFVGVTAGAILVFGFRMGLSVWVR